MAGAEGKKRKRFDSLGFFYPSESAPYVDADEYRALLRSGTLKEDDKEFLRQFLKEYYGRRTKSELLLHGPEHLSGLLSAQNSRRRDITLQKHVSKSFSRYTSKDHFQPRANPEELLIFSEELREYKKARKKESKK